MEAEDGGAENLLAARAARCVQRSLDGVLQLLIVADEIEQAKALRLVETERTARRSFGSVLVLTRPAALEFILLKRQETRK